MNVMEFTYRKTAATGAGGLSLLIALYDTLAGDLRRAALAQRSDDLEQRAREVKHALLVLAYLENFIEADGGDLAKSLLRFYARLRRKLIEAQSERSAELLEELMADVLGMRELWQQMEDKGAYFEPQILPPAAARREDSAFSGESERRHLSWSA